VCSAACARVVGVVGAWGVVVGVGGWA